MPAWPRLSDASVFQYLYLSNSRAIFFLLVFTHSLSDSFAPCFKRVRSVGLRRWRLAVTCPGLVHSLARERPLQSGTYVEINAMSSLIPWSDARCDDLIAGLSRPIVFVDLETTGSNAVTDRITEIGVVEVSRAGIERWSLLIDPQTPVPPFIEKLTGISDAMLSGQPLFAYIAGALAERLHGKLFVAHNARFDYGFLKNEFRRAGIAFRADVLCTVRLSRALFPSVQRHGLDALIARFGLTPEGRHRALADADLLWQFWQKIHESYSADLVDTAIRALVRHASLPPSLPEHALDAVPPTPGVYLFFGDDDTLLYVGKSVNLKQRVASHFSGDHRLAKDLTISQEIRRIACRETVGELGALLLEAKLIKDLQPVHNRLLRRASGACSWQWLPGASAPLLMRASRRDVSREPGLFGVYASRAKAVAHLRHIADENGLCHALLGLEKVEPGRGCFGLQVKRCAGACVGHEPRSEHDARFEAAIASMKMVPWPHSGAIAFIERHAASGRVAWHVVDRWCYLGTCLSREGEESAAGVAGVDALIAQAGTFRPFDADVYAVLAKHVSAGDVEMMLCESRPVLELSGMASVAKVTELVRVVKRQPRNMIRRVDREHAGAQAGFGF